MIQEVLNTHQDIPRGSASGLEGRRWPHSLWAHPRLAAAGPALADLPPLAPRGGLQARAGCGLALGSPRSTVLTMLLAAFLCPGQRGVFLCIRLSLETPQPKDRGLDNALFSR